MFRVPRRTTAPSVVAPPDRPTWHGTLTARPEPGSSHAPQAAIGVAASDRLRVAPWESIPAPWGEPDNPVPYVVITTHPWPEEWWRPNVVPVRREAEPGADLSESRLAAAGRVTAIRAVGRVTATGALERITAARLNGAGPSGAGSNGAETGGSRPRTASAQNGPSRIGFVPVVRGGATPPAHDDSLPVATPLRDDRASRREGRIESVAEVRARRELERERLAEARARRRGMLTRLAIFAAGLVISLIAVETAARRRS